MKVIGFIGDSGSGKTTLIERLVAHYAGAGMRVAAVKHAHHGFDIDRPGKDSYRFREAGACQVLVASDRRWVLMGEMPERAAPDEDGVFARQLARLDPCDLVLVEGFRGQRGIAYIEVRRRGAPPPPGPGHGAPRPPEPGRVAIASDGPLAGPADAGLVRLDLNDVEAIARFIDAHAPASAC